MSFWEDRFVNRPHAGALPPSPYTEMQSSSPEHSSFQGASPEGSAYPQLPSPDDEHAWGSETTSPADDVADSVEITELDQADVADDPFADAVEEPAQEYERKGLFRRRKPVLVEAEADDEAAQEDEPAALEAYDEQADSDFAEPESWSVVSDPEPDVDLEQEDAVSDPVEDEPTKKRGIFRRRKHDANEDALELEPEAEFQPASEDEPAFEPVFEPTFEPGFEPEPEQQPEAEPEYDPWHAPTAEDEQDEFAAEAETFEAPEEQPKRRGLFRRRKSEPVDVPVDEDADASAVEDDSFENVTYWGSEVTPDADEPVEETGAEGEPERQFEETDTFVYGEDESTADDSTPEPEPEETAHDVVLDGSEHAPEDAAFESEPELEAPEVEAEEPAFHAADSAVDDEPADDVTAEEPTAVEDEHEPDARRRGVAWRRRGARGLRDRLGE